MDYLDPDQAVFITLHEADCDKVKGLAKRMRRDGWQGRPVLVLQAGDETHALTGTHRIAAAMKEEVDIPAYFADVDPEDAAEVIEAIDDEDRLNALRGKDAEAAALMAAEIEANNES